MDHLVVKDLPCAADAGHGPVDAVAVGARDRPPAHRGSQQPRGAPPARHGGPGHPQADAARAHDNAAAPGCSGRPAAVARPQGGLK